MGTKLDRSERSGVLVICTDCPYWFEFRRTVEGAHDSACDHEERVHPGRNEASTRRAQFHRYAQRHAVRFAQSQ